MPEDGCKRTCLHAFGILILRTIVSFPYCVHHSNFILYVCQGYRGGWDESKGTFVGFNARIICMLKRYEFNGGKAINCIWHENLLWHIGGIIISGHTLVHDFVFSVAC